MECVIQTRIEKLPEGVHLATTDEVRGLAAQGRSIQVHRDSTRPAYTCGGVMPSLKRGRIGDEFSCV
jgi:hypothetical protein